MAESGEGMEDFVDNEEEIDDGKHEKLLNSIFALDGKKRHQNVVRGLSSTSSNVDLIVHAGTSKIKLEDLNIKPKNVQTQLKTPMSKHENEKAHRQIAREHLVTEMSKWEPVVKDIRAAPQTIFSNRPHGIKMYEAIQPKAFAPRTPLEKELYEALGKSEDIIRPNQEMTVAEARALKAMSVKEAKQRRAELLKHHELLSRMELKAKWQNKIKSKRYRKIVRKEKVMAEKKQLEQLQKADPEAFLEKLDQMEKSRMEERLTLKHRGGGKFSRMHKAYSKFDDKTRDAMQEMLQKSRELTKKRQDVNSSSDEDNNDDKDKNDNINSGSDDESEDDGAKTAGLRASQRELSKAIHKKAGGWLDVPNTTFVYVQPQCDTSVDTLTNGLTADVCPAEIKDTMELSAKNTSRESFQCLSVGEESEVEALKQADISDDQSSFSIKAKRRKIADNLNNSDANISVDKFPECSQKVVNESSDVSDLEESENIRNNELEESFAEENISQVRQNLNEPERKKKKRNKKKKNNDSLNDIISGSNEKPVKEITLQVVSDKTDNHSGVHDDEEEDGSGDEMKVTMEELFQDEDVVEEFAKEKADAEERSRPKLEDTRLPGWGIWAGPDYNNNKQNERRKKKDIAKARRLQHQQQKIKQPHVWLNPNRDDAIRKLQPKTVPFPYTSVQQYEASLRQPVSRGFVRETAFKLLTKPEVVTKLGHIIKPLDKEDFFKKREVEVPEEGGLKTSESMKRGNRGHKRKSIT